MEESYVMWWYWKEKRGIRSALECDYPDALASNPHLQNALDDIEMAEQKIDAIMTELGDEYV
jgi:hypothetical protein